MKKNNTQRLLGFAMALVVLGGQFLMPLEKAVAAPTQALQSEIQVVNINRANAAELEAIRGVGPVLAQRILEYRKANGDFKRVEDLAKVTGIGPSKFEKLKTQITI